MILTLDTPLKREHFQQKETIVTIIAEKGTYIETAKKEIRKRRNEIEQFIQEDEFFENSLKPYSCSKKGPEIIKKMCESSEKLNVGPMATVAGIIAEYAVKAMISKGAKHAIVDNGGDIAIFSNRTVNVGIYTGNRCTGRFAFQVLSKDEILGICTSSGKIGHSLSFGNTDAVTVISHDVAVADAAATALGNLVYTRQDVKNAFKVLDGINEIIGAAVIIGDKIGLWGDVPQIVTVDVPYKLITRGR
jgi:ApbE superfamily uncharacterized protein (UPF0280 family)